MAFTIKVTRKLMIPCYVVRRFAKHVNPGLSHQIKAIDDAVEVIQSNPEGFEGLESDLFNVHKSHKEHELEQIRHRENIKMNIIKNKYFRKERLPNLLTYAEKENIRYLHSSDQEEWTVEKLADSFPANAEVISKIVKSSWSAISSKRIRFHDARVMENWARFKHGEYKAIISRELHEHISKFADRNEIDMQNSKDLSRTFPKKQWQKPTSIEFSSIINTVYKKKIDTNKIKLLGNKAKDLELAHISLDNETYIQGHIKNRKPITIHELKNQQPNQNCTENKTDSIICNTNMFEMNEIVINKFDRQLYGISETKQRIHIPRKLWRKGATYRAKNCYYDDDGELLYKVPGMGLQ